MHQMPKEQNTKDANLYRVRMNAGRWHVYKEAEFVPLASFNDKAAALNYAMCLARGRVAWHLLLRQNVMGAERGQRAGASAHH